jgi:Putative Ig domain
VHKTLLVCLSVASFLAVPALFPKPVQAQIKVAPTSLSFRNVAVNTTSSAETLVVTNESSQPYSVLQVYSSVPEFIVIGPAMPLTLAANGSASFQVEFAPTSVASFRGEIAVSVKNSDGEASTVSVRVRGAAASATPETITTTSIPSGQVGTAYSTTLAASGGTTPYGWSISSGALPGGLTLSTSGTIAGTPTVSGSFTFTAKVTDSTTPTAQTATKSFTLTVAAAVTPVSITTTSLPNGQQNTAYSGSLAATGGTTPYTWSVSSGALPIGLSLSSSGVISGTPTGNGTSTFTVKVTDSTTPTVQTATQSLSITIAVAVTPVTITTTSIPSGQVGTAYSTALAASGGTTPYSWSISSGSLPAGLTLSTASTISGTPTASGSFTFTVKVTDSTTPTAQTATQSLTLTISSAATTLQITTLSLPNGVQGTAYTTTLAATGGTTPYSWSISSGSLPAGLTLAAPTGVISGTPTATGTSSFTVKVTDSTTPTAQTATANFSLTVSSSSGSSVLLNWTASPSSGVTGYNVYRSTVDGSGYVKINPSPVSGLTYNDASVVSGTTYYYVTTAVDNSGDESGFSEVYQAVIP